MRDKLKIPRANSSTGNFWRLEMENTYKAAVETEPYRSQVFGEVDNASNDMSDQAQQLSNLIAAVTCGITFTFGGLRVDPGARVLDGAVRPIPGLYAAGELLGGLFYHNYPGGSGLTFGTVFGRRAGAGAAERARGG